MSVYFHEISLVVHSWPQATKPKKYRVIENIFMRIFFTAKWRRIVDRKKNQTQELAVGIKVYVKLVRGTVTSTPSRLEELSLPWQFSGDVFAPNRNVPTYPAYFQALGKSIPNSTYAVYMYVYLFGAWIYRRWIILGIWKLETLLTHSVLNGER